MNTTVDVPECVKATQCQINLTILDYTRARHGTDIALA